MTSLLQQAVDRLTRVLTDENAALAALDLPRATACLAEKRAALEAVEHMERMAVDPSTLRRLGELCQENRRLLTRAIAVQQRLIALVAAAIPKPDSGGRYAANGRMSASARAQPATLLTKA